MAGCYDHGEQIFDLCEIPRSIVQPHQVAAIDLKPDQILFVNCPVTANSTLISKAPAPVPVKVTDEPEVTVEPSVGLEMLTVGAVLVGAVTGTLLGVGLPWICQLPARS